MRTGVLRITGLLCLMALGSMPAISQATTPSEPHQTGKSVLLVVDKGDNSLVLIDPISLKSTARIPVGTDPHEVTVSSDGKTAYVSNYGGPGSNLNTIAVIDLVAAKALPSINLGPLHSAHGLAFANGKLYFTAETNKVIGRYDPSAGQVDWVLGTGQNRNHLLIVTRDGKQFITSNIGSDSVSIISQVVRSAPPPGGPGQGGGGGRQGGNRPGGGGSGGGRPGGPGGGGPRSGVDYEVVPVKAGKGPEGIALSPDEKEIWAGNSLDGTISIIDVATKQVVQTLKTEMNRLNRIRFTPDGTHVLVSALGSGDLLVFESATRKEIKRLKIGSNAGGILVQPDGTRAYVACNMDNNVAVIDMKTLTIIGRIDSGQTPDGMAWVSGG